MALHLLLSGAEDERLLLTYVVAPPVYISGLETDDTGEPLDRLSIEEVLELDYSEPLSYGLLNPALGPPTSVPNSQRKLSWKSEVLFHEDFLAKNKGRNVLDPYLSPIILYRRLHFVGDFIGEAILIPMGAEANPSVNAWYKRIYSWCCRRATNVFSWRSQQFPGQFVSETVNTRWAFPGALRELRAGRTFCRHGLTQEGIEAVRKRQQRWAAQS